MMKNTQMFLIWMMALLIGGMFVSAAGQTIPPRPQNYVNDYADLLSPEQEATLNRMLRAYEDSTSNQVVVAIFPDAEGYPVEDFSIRLAEAWKVGQKGRDNGAILAVFLKERKVRIEVGYGLEDVIPDARAFQIIRDFITPEFKRGDYYSGIRDGVQAIMASASGKYAALKAARKRKQSPPVNLAALIIFLIVVFFLMLSARRRRGFVADSRGWRRSGPTFWGGFGAGGFGGGAGGGGFSGGGGGFGGGGATGSW